MGALSAQLGKETKSNLGGVMWLFAQAGNETKTDQVGGNVLPAFFNQRDEKYSGGTRVIRIQNTIYYAADVVK